MSTWVILGIPRANRGGCPWATYAWTARDGQGLVDNPSAALGGGYHAPPNSSSFYQALSAGQALPARNHRWTQSAARWGAQRQASRATYHGHPQDRSSVEGRPRSTQSTVTAGRSTQCRGHCRYERGLFPQFRGHWVDLQAGTVNGVKRSKKVWLASHPSTRGGSSPSHTGSVAG